ncbi:MAG: hypothetical protein LBV23_07860, partial [Deltaproteobacteria bacterium]|nr:hypothetical protein [Deltaproteobacteria bacterium]
MTDKKVIGFFTDGPSFEGDALKKKPLGGAETAFIQITKTLADFGHQVYAFNNCKKETVSNKVFYLPFRRSLNLLARLNFDVMVVSRFFGFFSLPIKSQIKVLWNHDTLDNPKVLRAVQDEIDIFFVLSRFHRDNFLTRLPQLDDRMVITRNGLDFELIDKGAKGAKKIPGKLIYSSRPERGLKILLELVWPRLTAVRPDLRLYLCGYNVDRSLLDPALISLYDHLRLIAARDPKIINLGPLSKREYYHHLAEAQMMVYPSCFPEISCLAALEIGRAH